MEVVVDCTLKGIGVKNLERYGEYGVKAVFQDGEKHSLTEHSFVAQANYKTTLGLREVSFNTTSTVRTLTAHKYRRTLENARGVLVLRATDLWKSDHSGIMNTFVPETVDAIRALAGTVKNGRDSISLTDAAMGMCKDFTSP